jgi:hypothetical protein
MSVTIELRTRDSAIEYLHNADLESYDSTPILAEDGMIPVASRLNAVVTATISVADWQAMQAFLNRAGNRMQHVRMYEPHTPASRLVDFVYTETSDGGPFVKATATEVIGTTFMLVRLDIHQEEPWCKTRPLLSHVWRQSMSLNPTGRLSRTVDGQIRAFMPKDGVQGIATTAAWTDKVGHADLFRNLVWSDVPGEGWRRTSASFAYDPTNTILTYQYVDEQHQHDLPNWVRAGDMEFSYERSAEQAGVANCSFSCELEGDLRVTYGGVNGTGNRVLVDAAVKLSKTRINANFGNVIVTRLRITERNILTGPSIRFELDATTFPASTSGTSAAIVPLAYMIGKPFTITRTMNRMVNPYGAWTPVTSGDPPTTVYRYVSMVPHWLSAALSGMENCDASPAPSPGVSAVVLLQQNLTDSGEITVTYGSQVDGTTAMNTEFNGKYASAQYQDQNSNDNYVQIVAHNISVTNAGYKSGLVRLSPMYVTGADLVFQTQKPLATVRERIEVAKANVAPGKVLRPLPTGAFVLSEDWNVTFGKFDAQGNRVFVGTFERTYAMIDDGNAGRGFATQATGAFGNVRAWGAPSSTLVPTIAKVATTASQDTSASVFAGSMSADQKYGTGATETFVT